MPAGGCAVGKIGNRPSMEDAHVVSVLGNDIYLYAVFDGHGGKQISSKLPSVLPKALYQKLVRTNLNNEEEIRQAIINTYLEVDKSFMNVDSGSAAIAVLKIKNKLFFVNLGDSRAVLIEGGRIVHETRDHKPDVPEERRRIEKAGGRVDTQMYPPRVNGILSLSRAFGDRHLKTSSRHSGYAGVDSIISPKPDVTVFTLRSGHKYTLVLACDGLWDVFPSQDVDEYVHKVTTSNACNELVNQAIGRGSGDNVTVMVTEFSV
jgi:serine/threonine protein phosphatase PrpC